MNERIVLVAAGLIGLAAALAIRQRGQLTSEGDQGSGEGWGEWFPLEVQDPAPSPFEAVADQVRQAAATVYEWAEEGLQTVGFVNASRRYQETIARAENAQLVAWLRAAEDREGIPAGLLVRLAYQESRFRPDIITGQVRSSAGAVGLMQIVPRWHPDVDATDPRASIDYAARYLRQLRQQFGSWEYALKAYNTGPGNLRKILAGTMSEPAETRAYSAQILADVPGLNPRGVIA